MIPTSSPNASQSRWMEAVRALGSIVSHAPAIVHHCAGRTARHNKVDIGHWWIIPLTDDEHRRLHDDGETFGFPSRKQFEKSAFLDVMHRLIDLPECDLPTSEVTGAILDYRR